MADERKEFLLGWAINEVMSRAGLEGLTPEQIEKVAEMLAEKESKFVSIQGNRTGSCKDDEGRAATIKACRKVQEKLAEEGPKVILDEFSTMVKGMMDFPGMFHLRACREFFQGELSSELKQSRGRPPKERRGKP